MIVILVVSEISYLDDFSTIAERFTSAGLSLLMFVPFLVLFVSMTVVSSVYFQRVGLYGTLLLLFGTKKVTKTTPQTEAADKFREACLTYETQLKEYFAATSIQKTS